MEDKELEEAAEKQVEIEGWGKFEGTSEQNGIKNSFIAGAKYILEKQSTTGLRWVKASERLPKMTNGYAKQICTKWYFEDGYNQLRTSTVNQFLDLIKTSYDLNKIEWLDESSPSIVDEKEMIFDFTEYCGEHYIKVHGGWFGRFADQRDIKNVITTKEIYDFYIKAKEIMQTTTPIVSKP